MQNPSLSLYVLAAIIFFSSIIWPGCKKKDEPSEDSVDTRTPKSRTKPKPQLPPRTTDPTFSPEVPADVRNIITALLAAYHRGDGESAYACLNTSRKEFRIANAFGTTQIPIMNAKVSLSNEDQVMIEYEMPHPGDIIAVILRGGENVDAIKKGLDALRSVEDCLKKTENWSVVRAGNIVKIDYAGKGILRLTDVIGTSVHSYVTNIEDRRFSDRPLIGPLPHRVTWLMADYFMAFDIKTDSPEMERVTLKTFKKIKDTLEDMTRQIAQPTYTINIPFSWKDALKIAKREVEGGFMYAGKTRSGDIAVVAIKKELEIKPGDKLSGKSNKELLLAATSIDKLQISGKVVEAGDSQVGGVPAKFFIEVLSPPDKPRQCMLRYVFIKDKVIYSMTFNCDEQEFDNNYDQFMEIKESFRFRKTY